MLDVHHVNKSLAMGRKRNQGKARREAKAKAREVRVVDGRDNNNQAVDSLEQSLSAEMQHFIDGEEKCRHQAWFRSFYLDG